jgi:hypothetical protein
MTLVVPSTFLAARTRFDFHQWILELDEPSRDRFERFIELVAEAAALGTGGAGAEASARQIAASAARLSQGCP